MSVKPQRIRLSRKKGFNLHDVSRRLNGLEAVNVARPGPFGNPFVVGDIDTPDAALAVEKFRRTVIGFESNGSWCRPVAHPDSYIGKIISDIEKLRGKNLACWCALDAPCHADVLLALANPGTEGWLARDLNSARNSTTRHPS